MNGLSIMGVRSVGVLVKILHDDIVEVCISREIVVPVVVVYR